MVSIEAIATIEAPTVEIPLPANDLSHAIASTEIDISKGLNTQQAFKLAQKRGYAGNDKTFRDRFDKSNYGDQFGLKRIPHKSGRENWLYFDTKSRIAKK